MLKRGDQYMLISFDTESDIGSWTQDYTSIDLALPKIVNVLGNHDVSATFYCEAMAALHNEAMIQSLAESGHEVGCHSYKHETLGDVNYFIPGDRAILPEEIPLRLGKATDVLERITGIRPVSFRAPRLWGSGAMNKVLEDLGYHSDSSFPISQPSDPIFPYHPDHEDWSRPGQTALLELPVAGLYGEMLNGLPPELTAFGEEFKTGAEHSSIGQWPILRLYGAEALASFLDPFIHCQVAQQGYSVVCVYLHPWEFIPMPGVLDGIEARVELRRTLYENCGDFALESLDALIDVFKSRDFQFVTASQIFEIVESES